MFKKNCEEMKRRKWLINLILLILMKKYMNIYKYKYINI